MKTKRLWIWLFLTILGFLTLFVCYAGLSVSASQTVLEPESVEIASRANLVYTVETPGEDTIGILAWTLVGTSCAGVVLAVFLDGRSRRRRPPSATVYGFRKRSGPISLLSSPKRRAPRRNYVIRKYY